MENESIAVPEGGTAPSGAGPEARITQGWLAGSLGMGKELERFCELI